MLPLYVLERPTNLFIYLISVCLLQIYGQKVIRCKFIFKIVCKCLEISADNFKLKLRDYVLL